MLFERKWAMPNGDTFSVPCIGEFVRKYLDNSMVSVDPFARNKQWATWTNDLNPNTEAEFHMDASAFMEMLHRDKNVRADLVLLDPPYSPRQVSDLYKELGWKASQTDTQNAALYSRVKAAAAPLMSVGSICLSFGWNSSGMGKKYGFEPIEILLVAHGGAHNDTICMAERRVK